MLQAANLMLTALVKAMKELRMVGVASKVYNKGNAPSIGALFPETENDHAVSVDIFVSEVSLFISTLYVVYISTTEGNYFKIKDFHTKVVCMWLWMFIHHCFSLWIDSATSYSEKASI